MSTLSKIVLGAMGALRPRPSIGDAVNVIELPPPDLSGGASLLEALGKRRSSREYRSDALPLPMLSTLLWAADGVNRSDGGRTAPSALGVREIDVVVALPHGAYRFDPDSHALQLICAQDVRRVTGYQDFVDEAALDLVYLADHARMRQVPVAQRTSFSSVAAGAIAQNVYLFAASVGLSTVLRAWIDREAIAQALGLSHDHDVLLSQTVGFSKG
ncbi:MAG: nitroreductase family protein [Pseudomonadota bacterium]